LRINEVCGALNGSSNRYKKEISLVELGLVEKEEREGVWCTQPQMQERKHGGHLRSECVTDDTPE